MATHTIRCGRTGKEFLCAEDQPLLIAMERCGQAAIPVGCRGGGCGFCRIKIISGDIATKKMSRKHITDEDQEAGLTLACRTFPRSDVLFEVNNTIQP